MSMRLPSQEGGRGHCHVSSKRVAREAGWRDLTKKVEWGVDGGSCYEKRDGSDAGVLRKSVTY
jgi:hypothetical protein